MWICKDIYASRTLSGIGGGGISSLVAIIVSDLVSLKERGKYQGFISLAMGSGAMIGPFVSASLVRTGGWRWGFRVPSLLASGCFILIWFLLPSKQVTGNWKEKVQKIDWFGIGTSLTGITYSSPDLEKLRRWYLAMAQFFDHLHIDQSAILILPFLLAQSLAGALSGPVMSRIARYNPVLRSGFMLWTIGVGFILLFSQTTPVAVYVVDLVLVTEGAGVGFVHQPGLVALQALSKTKDRAVATSARNLLRSLGGVLGVAVSTAAQYSVTAAALRKKVPSSILTQVLDGSWQKGEAGSEMFQSDILDAKMKRFRVVFIMLVPLMWLCTLGSLFVADTILKGDGQNDQTEGEG